MRLVLFDFDGTLTRRDSLLPFLLQRVGPLKFIAKIILVSPVLLALALRLIRNDRAKEMVLTRFLGGEPLSDLSKAGQRFALDSIPRMLRPDTMSLLKRHQDRGDTCVLVSASLDLYLNPWAGRNGFSAVLCSSLEVLPDGLVSGRLSGKNCFGPVKAQRIGDWLNGEHPEHITAYGDSSGDLEMLLLADSQYWAGKSPPPCINGVQIRSVATIL